MSLPSEVRAKYVDIIDDILDKADLTTISVKQIRNGIQDRVEYDITPQKGPIKELIEQRFDLFNARQARQAEPVPSIEKADVISHTNGHLPSTRSPTGTPAKREAEDDDFSDIIDNVRPKKKRRDSVDEDAAFAARLQAEEDKRARPTRNGAARKAAPKRKTPKKKTASKITGSDDSDVEDDGGSGRKVNRDTGFHKPLTLSPALSELFDGEPSMSRPQVTKRIWQYIKARDLQDPSDKRFILCDDQLRNLFKQDRVHMFQMTKLLNQQMYEPEG